MPLNILALLALGGAALGNLFWEAYFILWFITIIPVTIATFAKVLKREMKTYNAYFLTTLSVVNFAASAGFFLSFGMFWAALFMLAFAIYWAVPAVRLSRRMASFTDATPTKI